jgi:uncharacterized sulfatase
MTYRRTARQMAPVLTVLAVVLSSAIAPAAASKPNIVLVIADDMAWLDCGPYGSKEVRTPNIDRLASQGMTFERAFTATAMCSPTRQQLYTGVFPVRNGAYPNHSKVKPGTRSMVHHLGSLGYRVGLIGKKHIGPRDSFPFAAASESFVTGRKGEPFCLVVASNQPHVPWNAGPRDYDPEKLTVPPHLVDNRETRKNLAAYYSEVTAFDAQVGRWMQVVDGVNLTRKTIFLVTSEQGAQFPGGKWTCYDYGLRTALIFRWPGKVKAGSRSRAMVQYVDVLPTLVEAAGGDPAKIDTGLAGAPGGGRGFDGRSFLGVLLGKTDVHNKYVFGVHTTQGIIAGNPYPIRSIRDGKYKYIMNLMPEATFQNTVTEQDGQGYWAAWKRDAATDPRAGALVQKYQKRPAEEFYDVEKDPLEQKNLAADPSRRARMDAMKRELLAWMAQQGDRGVETELAASERRSGRKRAREKKARPR